MNKTLIALLSVAALSLGVAHAQTAAPAAAAALDALGAGDLERFHRILTPTVPLSRHMFRSPTRFYKTGVVFMAWLNGHQDHFVMVGGQQSTRSLPHFAELFRLADAANLLEQPELAVRRMNTLLAYLTAHCCQGQPCEPADAGAAVLACCPPTSPVTGPSRS